MGELGERGERGEVQRLGVVGAGQVGQGIAQIAAKAGIGKIKKTLDRLVEKGKLDGAARDQAMGRLRAGERHEDLDACDLVIEAAPEREELKLAIFKSLGAVCKDDAILASNTSSI